MDVAISFTHRPIHTGQETNRRLDGPQRWCGLLIEEEKLCCCSQAVSLTCMTCTIAVCTVLDSNICGSVHHALYW